MIEHREALIYMLYEAAKLEHGIMGQYLFAAFSLKQTAAEGLTAEQLEAVLRWRKQISHVARGQDFATVGHLYRSIEAGFAHLAARNGADWLFAWAASRAGYASAFRLARAGAGDRSGQRAARDRIDVLSRRIDAGQQP